MNSFTVVLVIIAAASAFFAVAAVLVYREKTRRMLIRIDAMLTAAIDGSFTEQAFDESLLSSVETRLAHYLSASGVSAKNLAEEKDKIKELISDISHQTKTPIANIMLYSQLLREQALPKQSVDCVAVLNSQADKLGFLIEALVKTSRLETGVFELRPVTGSIDEMLSAAAKSAALAASAKGIKIIREQTAATARFDSKWTTEAVYNIVDNAVKYTPPGGEITIETTPYDLFCRVDIIDSGIGIPEGEQAKIFGRFYRGAETGGAEGVGIGLYLARQIMTGEGGYIKVKSAPGEGSVFSVFIPVGGQA